MKLYLDIVIYIFSILGGVVSIISLYKYLVPQKRINWKAVEKGILNVRDKMIKDNYMPSLIVGIGRGGSISGALLSGSLGHIPLLVIDRAYNWDDNIRQEKLVEEIKLNRNLDRVLLVAGELHSGGTAKTYLTYFKNLGAKDIKVFSFLTEKYPSLQPDYHSIESDNPDMRLPWMITKEYKRDSKSQK